MICRRPTKLLDSSWRQVTMLLNDLQNLIIDGLHPVFTFLCHE